MHFKIEEARDYLRAELCERRTGEESEEFVRELLAKAAQSGLTRVLIHVRNSRPIYKLSAYGIIDYFRQVAKNPANRVALVSDTEEMRSSQQYIAMLGREQGAKVAAFRDDAAALDWLRSAS